MEGAVNNSSVASESHEESKFAGVVFHNVQDIYIPGKDIRCCYSIKPYVSTTANDWIGLYKVGWQSPKDYLCYEYSPVIENATELTVSLSTQNSVVFRGNTLPSEECEFYQFCYVTSSGEIRGASYPFQISFSKPGELEICSEEEDDGLLIVNNRTTHLENSLAKAFDENAALKASKEKVEADFLKFQDMILSLEAKKTDLVCENGKQKKMLKKAISEKTDFEENYKETLELLKSSQTALKLANGKTAEIQQQLDNERAQHVQKTSEQQKFEEERKQFLEVISHKDSVIQDFFNTVEANSGKTAALESEIQKLKSDNEAQQEDYDSLVLEKAKGDDSLKKSEQALAALEKSQAEQCEQVCMLQAENSMMKEELDVVRERMEEMSDCFSNQQSSMEQKHLKECCNLENQILVITAGLNGCKQELADSKEKLDEVLLLLDMEKKGNQDVVQGYEDSFVKMLDQLKQERDFNNSLSSASDRQVAELQEQLNVQLQKNASALKQTEEQIQEIKHLEENMGLNETEIEKMRKEIDEQAQQLDSIDKRENESLQSNAATDSNPEKNAALEGSYFALKTAHDQLRKQYLEAKKDMQNLWRQKADLKRQLATVQSDLPDSDLRFQMANLKKQIEDLRIRLNMGAEAYKAKFKECQKYEKQLKKMRKDSSGRSTPQSPSSATDFEIRNLKQSLENEKTTSATLKKSLENYKTDAHGAKQEQLKIQKENEFLQRQVLTLEKEACVNNDETEKRLIEDKELQSHMECLYTELEAKCEALKEIEMKYKTATEPETERPLREEREKLQLALVELGKENQELVVHREQMLQQIEKQAGEIEELKEMAGLMDSVATHGEENSNQDNVFESAVIVENSRGPPPSAPSAPAETGHQCPVCQIFFPPNCPPEGFAQHVNSHFND